MIPLKGARTYSNWSNTHIVWDGSSLIRGLGASGSNYIIPNRVNSLYPINNQATFDDVSLNGQTWRNMNGLDGGSSSDVDAAFVNGKNNILILLENSNSIYAAPNRTANQAFQDAKDYITARKNTNNWYRIIVLTSLPRQASTDGTTVDQNLTNTRNIELNALDDLMRKDYRQMGADALVDIRAEGSVFKFTDYTSASFENISQYWYDSPRIHMNDAGYTLMSDMISRTLARII